jgi:hypothetical protein
MKKLFVKLMDYLKASPAVRLCGGILCTGLVFGALVPVKLVIVLTALVVAAEIAVTVYKK